MKFHHRNSSNGRAREVTRTWKTKGLHQSKQKNKSAQSAGPIISQHFPTQVSPNYIQLDPIYYVMQLQKIVIKVSFIEYSDITFFSRSVKPFFSVLPNPIKNEKVCGGVEWSIRFLRAFCVFTPRTKQDGVTISLVFLARATSKVSTDSFRNSHSLYVIDSVLKS